MPPLCTHFVFYADPLQQSLCRVELVKLLPVNRYSVDNFLYSGPLGILGSDRNQNTLYAGGRGRENFECGIS